MAHIEKQAGELQDVYKRQFQYLFPTKWSVTNWVNSHRLVLIAATLLIKKRRRNKVGGRDGYFSSTSPCSFFCPEGSPCSLSLIHISRKKWVWLWVVWLKKTRLSAYGLTKSLTRPLSPCLLYTSGPAVSGSGGDPGAGAGASAGWFRG